MSARRRVQQFLAHHNQAITVAEARNLGLEPDVLQRLAAAGDLERVRQSSYLAYSADPDFMQTLDIAIRLCERRAVVARSAAMRLLNLRHPAIVPRPEVVVEGSTLPELGDGVEVHRTRRLAEVDITQRAGMEVTTAERTVIDMAQDLSRVRTLQLVDRALDDGIASARLLFERAEALQRGRRHMRLLMMVTGSRGTEKFRSFLERSARPILIAAGLTDVRFNVVPRHAPDAGEMDAVSELHRVVIELDGLQWHRDGLRRQRDNDKGNAVTLGSYTLLRFTYGDIMGRPQRVDAQVAAVLRRRGA